MTVPRGLAEALVDRYRLERELGQGGMATVYLAQDLRHAREVAIKVMRLELAAAVGQERFRREIEVAARLTHPNILPVHDSGLADGYLYYVMPFIAGESLRARLDRDGQLAVGEAVRLAREAASALAYAHQRGVVHRDIKPENILLADGIALVADFGIARAVAGGDPSSTTETGPLTEAGVVIGTPKYIAPEQAAGGEVDGRTDVYSLACVLYEMLAGRPPFAAPTKAGLIQQHLTAQAPAVSELRRDLPPSLTAAIARGLAKRPADRFESATAFAEALRLPELAESGEHAASVARRSRAVAAAAAAVGLLAAAGLVWSLVHQSRLRWARETAVAEIGRLTAADDLVGAYRVGRRAMAIAPDDSEVRQTWSNLTVTVTIRSEPPGAEVAFRSYVDAKGEWLPLGTTPLENQAVPVGMLRWRLTKPGYRTLEVGRGADQVAFRLVPEAGARPGMVFVPAGPVEFRGGSVWLPAYWLDRDEVSNREYEAFVKAGGYRRQEFWKEPFLKDGRRLTWEEAMAELRDTTGRPGPATWELGSYPKGRAEYPVSGVSWYEAAAYAEFAGKRLPTAYHWYRASGAFGIFSEILTASNFSGEGPVPVGSALGLGPYGTDDMAGNVKEWCWNPTTRGRRYLLGGGWNEAGYMFRASDALPPLDRRAAYGFRCMWQEEPPDPRLTGEITTFERDPSTLKPVGDELYRAYRSLYDYDPTPLDARVEAVDDANPAWREEQISVRAAYGSERLPIRLFLPKSTRPPYQAVVFFPPGAAVFTPSSQHLQLRLVDFVVRGGRALVYPIYKGTYERRVPGPSGPAVLRDVGIERGKDLRRAIDYLETRSDIDGSKLAFQGLSLGAKLAPIFLAIEPRLRTGVLFSGGFETEDMPPEVDPVNFAPHVKVPVLMVNGREDFDMPYATAQVPMFRMLGTPTTEKRHFVFEGGHLPPHPHEAIKVILDWLDDHLGPVS